MTWRAKLAPFLWRDCPFGKAHWRWDRICACSFGLPDDDVGTHGGVVDLAHDVELIPCPSCAHGEDGDDELTDEETALLYSWRHYRSEVLDCFDRLPYKYKVTVRLNDMMDSNLISHTHGLLLVGDGGSMSETVPKGKPSDGKAN